MLIVPSENHLIWLDDQFIPWNAANIHITAHHYGFGVFEGLRCYATPKGPAIFRLQAHTDRLFQSAHILNIQIPYKKEQLNQVQCEIIKINNLQNAYIRPFVFHDGLMGLSLFTEALKIHVSVIAAGWNAKGYHQATLTDSIKGIKLQTSSLIRSHANSLLLKAKANGNYMNAIMALKEARSLGADDALILDQQGYIAEASGANIFIVRNSKLYTPELTHALPGITRDAVFTLANELGLEVKEKLITRDELYIADEVFLTGTAAEITPVIETDKRQIGTGKIGIITEQIRNLFLSYVYGQRPDKYQWLTYVDNKVNLTDLKKMDTSAIA